MTNAEHQSDSVLKLIEENIQDLFSRVNWATTVTVNDLKLIFDNKCFYLTSNQKINDTINARLIDFTKIFIAGEDGDFDQFKAKLKSYDFSSTCGLVWTTNYFAYRCRTCCLSPSMSLCSACFNNGNHVGHDFNKFKSQAGGACDCGNPYVMKEFGYCKHHGTNKVSQQRDPPKSLISRLQMIMPTYLKCVLFSCWSLIQNADMDDPNINLTGVTTNTSDVLMPVLAFVNDLLSCGWVVQKLLAGIMIDKAIFDKFISDVKHTDQFYVYETALDADPDFKFPETRIESQKLNHQSLVDAFLFVCVKLRFPENLITFLIGLLTMESYKDVFVHSYLNHYSRMASTILIHAKSVRNGQDASYNMNNRIVHISVQLFSGEVLALKMVTDRNLHYLIVHCLLNMFSTALTRLDTNDNYVINCETPMIQNNVFWPLISDLTNLVTHKSVVDYFIADIDFMHDWTRLLKLMQFMNFFDLKEGNHIEYETMAFFHAYTMEIEISANSMWNIWYHYRDESDRNYALKLVNIFVTSLSDFLDNLGVFQTSNRKNSTRQPLSFHLPLMRNVACFVSLGLVYHNISLSTLLNKLTPLQIMRWFQETTNTLVGCQEVLIGYWVRNGQSVRTSTTYYIHSQFCYALIDMDIFAAQICAAVLPSSTVIYLLTDPSQILKGINFNLRCQHHSDSLHGPESMAEMWVKANSSTALPAATATAQNRNRTEKFNLEKQPLALEAWLTNLCWLLDLRNEMTVDDISKLRKEVCCELCPEPIKRSDLSHRLPEKTGINIQISPDVDSILKRANYTAPTFDEYSGNLQSGLYIFKPELWDTDYDPLFQSLRSVTKRDAADALAKYREYYRQKQNIAQANSLWPPYRAPKPPHSQLANLEKVLHCKDLTYILFCSLNMFINNDPVVTEDSLALVVHLILRSLSVPEPEDSLEEISNLSKSRFLSNQYKVNNAYSNLRYKVGLFADLPQTDEYNEQYYPMEMEQDIGPVVQRESMLSLLLKVHSRLHTNRLQLGGKSLLLCTGSPHTLTGGQGCSRSGGAVGSLQQASLGVDNHDRLDEVSEPMETDAVADCVLVANAAAADASARHGLLQSSHKNTSNRQGHSLDIKATHYFRVFPLVYQLQPQNIDKTKETGVGINWGDGVDFIGNLLDVIASRNDENSKALFELIDTIRESTKPASRCSPTSDMFDAKDGSFDNLDDMTGKNHMFDPMQEKKQKALDRRKRVIANMAMKQKAFASAHQVDINNQDISVKEEDEKMYECVICQLKSNPTREKMVLLGLLCSSGTLKYTYNQVPMSESGVMIQLRKAYCQSLRFELPVLAHGIIIQTCGHVVHLDCFDKYKAQRPAVTRMRRTITCPLCRRDVHHLTPIIASTSPDQFTMTPSHAVAESVDSMLARLRQALLEPLKSAPGQMVNHTIEESIAKSQVVRMLPGNEACCLLRSQLELELVICQTAPDQYQSVARRCHWPHFLAYLRALSSNAALVVYQADSLIGTDFAQALPPEERDADSLTNHFLFQSSVDVYCNFLPYIWPHRDWYDLIVRACLVFAYIKALVTISVKQDSGYSHDWTKANEQSLTGSMFAEHLQCALTHCSPLHTALLADTHPSSPLSEKETTILAEVTGFLLPVLRFAAVLTLRTDKIVQVPADFPVKIFNQNDDRFKELDNLCVYLGLWIPTTIRYQNPLDRIAHLFISCLGVTKYTSIDQLLNNLLTLEFVNVFVNEKQTNSNIETLSLGNELCPPRLIELPACYDDLFNAHHAKKCNNIGKAATHNFPENGLCLICGKLICLICESMPLAFNEHTKTCCFGVGLVIDVNTSIIHVLLNNEISQWGSVYLDYYGEEDLELKRGRPLFINTRRVKLLEQQWLTHSFKHVVKSWRRIS